MKRRFRLFFFFWTVSPNPPSSTIWSPIGSAARPVVTRSTASTQYAPGTARRRVASPVLSKKEESPEVEEPGSSRSAAAPDRVSRRGLLCSLPDFPLLRDSSRVRVCVVVVRHSELRTCLSTSTPLPAPPLPRRRITPRSCRQLSSSRIATDSAVCLLQWTALEHRLRDGPSPSIPPAQEGCCSSGPDYEQPLGKDDASAR